MDFDAISGLISTQTVQLLQVSSFRQDLPQFLLHSLSSLRSDFGVRGLDRAFAGIFTEKRRQAAAVQSNNLVRSTSALTKDVLKKAIAKKEE